MEKLNVAIADDNERIVELLDRIVSSDEELNHRRVHSPMLAS